VNDFLDKLAAGPLADPGKTFLPLGRRKGQRRTPDELDQFRADRLAKQERAAREQRDRFDFLFGYYARTDIPVERVADHMGIDVDRAREGLAQHGRIIPAPQEGNDP
jgi:hypothetical protein